MKSLCSIIIYGPPGSGKTKHSKEFSAFLGRPNIVEFEGTLAPYPAEAIILCQDGSLPNVCRAVEGNCLAMTVEEAKLLCGIISAEDTNRSPF